MKKKMIIAICSVLALGLITTGILLYNAGIIFPKAETVQPVKLTAPARKTITYRGHDDTSALVLLQQTTKVELSGSGENAFVTGIDSVKADSSKNEFWEFSVNGKSATVGAGSYITNDSDVITWKLSTF